MASRAPSSFRPRNGRARPSAKAPSPSSCSLRPCAALTSISSASVTSRATSIYERPHRHQCAVGGAAASAGAEGTGLARQARRGPGLYQRRLDRRASARDRPDGGRPAARGASARPSGEPPAPFAARTLPINRAVAERWGDLMAQARRGGIALSAMDGFFAATALVPDLTLATRNARDFAPLGVPLLNPWIRGSVAQ